MTVEKINGWTAEKLDRMRNDLNEVRWDLNEVGTDVGAINTTLTQMQSDETNSLRSRVKELEARPHRYLNAIAIPLLCACIPAVVILATHA